MAGQSGVAYGGRVRISGKLTEDDIEDLYDKALDSPDPDAIAKRLVRAAENESNPPACAW